MSVSQQSRCDVGQFFLQQFFWFSSTIEEKVIFLVHKKVAIRINRTKSGQQLCSINVLFNQYPVENKINLLINQNESLAADQHQTQKKKIQIVFIWKNKFKTYYLWKLTLRFQGLHPIIRSLLTIKIREKSRQSIRSI